MRSSWLLVITACSVGDPVAVPKDQWPYIAATITATTLAVDGAPAVIARCRVVENARNDGVALDLAHARGRLRFTRQHLYGARDPGDPDNGSDLHCTKLDRKWGGGIRTDGSRTGYWQGYLDVTCDRVTGRIGSYRSLVSSGAPKARAPAQSETPNLLPIP